MDKKVGEILEIHKRQAGIGNQMTKLIKITKEIGAASFSQSKNDLIKLVLLNATELFRSKIAIYWSYNETLGQFNFESIIGKDKNLGANSQNITFEKGFLEDVIRNGDIVVADLKNLVHHPKYIKDYFDQMIEDGLNFVISTPFILGENYLGVMNLYTSEKLVVKEWEKSWEKTFLELFTTQVSIVMQYHFEMRQLEERQPTSYNYIQNMIRLITHRLNNSVGNIRADAIDLLGQKNLKDHKTIKYIQQIYDQAEKALLVPKELSKFIAHLNSEKGDVFIKDVVDRIISEVQFEDIEFSFHNLDELPPVRANYGILKEVFNELFKNAARAMPYGGDISVAGKRKSIKKVEILIRDKGFGIPKKKLNRIFEYGYTGWRDGKGVGDGLALIKAVIEFDHKGKVSVESEPEKGTTFKLELPIYEKE